MGFVLAVLTRMPPRGPQSAVIRFQWPPEAFQSKVMLVRTSLLEPELLAMRRFVVLVVAIQRLCSVQFGIDGQCLVFGELTSLSARDDDLNSTT